MDIVQAVILGIIQGIFEWLPISSEGQSMLILLNVLHMGVDEALSIAIYLHLGTTFAVLIKFRNEFRSILLGLNNGLARIIIISTACTAITGLPLYFLLKNSFTGGIMANVFIGVLLICTGIILGINKQSGHKSVDTVTHFDMVILGLAQGFAILPGISRSGTTIATLLIRNVDQKSALVISFLISVPVVLGMCVLEAGTILTFDPYLGAMMFLSSLVTGYIMMDFLLKFAEGLDFSMFCIFLGLITILLSAGFYLL